MKKFSVIMCLLILSTLFLHPTSIHASNNLTSISKTVLNDQLNFTLDGKAVIPVGDDGTPVLPISYNGTTYLPIRAIGYLLGLGIDYDNTSKTVLITSTSSKPSPSANSTNKTGKLIPISGAVLNGQLKFKLDNRPVVPVGDDGTAVLPISYNGTTYLPVRAIGYLLALGIDYNNATKTVLISRSGNGNAPAVAGWYFTRLEMTQNPGRTENFPLAGTTSYMYDVRSAQGGKGNIEITHTRHDAKSNALLAEIKYQVIWTDPPNYLAPSQRPSMKYEIKTLSSKGWKLTQNSINFNQGWGSNFSTPDGSKYFSTDMNSTITLDKDVAKGSKGSTVKIQVVVGEGWTYTYHYEWRE